MNWPILIVVVLVLAVFLLLKRMSFVSPEVARRHLANGAVVIDVRSLEEFQTSCVKGAINIPLGKLRERVPQHVRDKSQVLLLHCLSGGRSGIAQQQLKIMGYRNALNLGSLGRAKKIVEGNPAG